MLRCKIKFRMDERAKSERGLCLVDRRHTTQMQLQPAGPQCTLQTNRSTEGCSARNCIGPRRFQRGAALGGEQMISLVNSLAKSRSIRSRTALPTTGPSGPDDEADDERRLVAELEAVLSRRPGADRAASLHGAEAPGSAGTFEIRSTGPDPYDLDPDGAFSWTPAHGERRSESVAIDDRDVSETDGEEDLRRVSAAPSTQSWVAKARRDRRWSRVRAAAAWLVTLLIAGGIIVGAAWLLMGGSTVLSTIASLTLVRLP